MNIGILSTVNLTSSVTLLKHNLKSFPNYIIESLSIIQMTLFTN